MCDLKFRDFDNILCIECCELQMFAFWKLSTQACIIDIDGTYMTLGTVGDTVSFMVTSRQEMGGVQFRLELGIFHTAIGTYVFRLRAKIVSGFVESFSLPPRGAVCSYVSRRYQELERAAKD